MQRTFKILGGLLAVLLLLGFLLWAMGYGYIFRGFQVVYLKGHTTAYIDDHPQFSNRVIEAGNNYQPWPEHKNYNSAQPTDKLKKTNEDLGTIAYLIIKNDSIWYEQYANGYDENSLTNSFSMAKSITTALLGKAVKDGYINSLKQPVKDFLPEFSSSL
jgi:CubicO group peptidase (beta-lactamase class C family)